MTDLSPVGLECTRCGVRRDVTPRVEYETGDFGSVLGSWLAYTVEPPCAGWVTHDGFWDSQEGNVTAWIDSHEASEGDNANCTACRAYEDLAFCPFDGGDDYQSVEEACVRAVLADRSRYRKAAESESLLSTPDRETKEAR